MRETVKRRNDNRERPATHDQVQKSSLISSHNRKPNSVLKLQELVNAMRTELDSLGGGHLLEIHGRIDFYSEVTSFEIGLIKGALQRTEGHQGRAARLLKLNPSTLNAKIKQYDIKFF